MPEKPYFRTAFGNQPVNGQQTLLKSARHYYYPIFPWVWDKLSWKKSALVRSKILGLFVNTLTAEYTYSGRNMQTLTQQVQTPLSLKQKFFWIFYCVSEILKVCILPPDYVYSALNVLTNSPNILDLTKADFFQLNLSQIHGKIG